MHRVRYSSALWRPGISIALHRGYQRDCRAAFVRPKASRLLLGYPLSAARLHIASLHDDIPVDSTASPSAQSFELTYRVVNFYHLIDLPQPHAVVRRHREWLQDRDILGRIYISSQGINAQLSGPETDAQAYVEWVLQQPEFKDLRWSSDPADSHKFPRLRLKVRESLVSLTGGTQSLPLTDSQARAKPLTPAEWHSMLQTTTSYRQSEGEAHPPSTASTSPAPLILDVRNSYEWDAGHFQGAQRPHEDHFNQTPTCDVPEQLGEVPRDTPIMMYCTGGIRCDIYSAVLKRRGFNNLFTLEGGVANYLRAGPSPGDWKGSLFTFDDRLAVTPEGGQLRDANLVAAAPCRVCGSQASLPHMNCANIDCNRLFLACTACQARLGGCCCTECEAAPRFLRPRKAAGTYAPWHTIPEAGDSEGVRAAMALGRGGGRTAKRQRRLQRLRAKHAAMRGERAHRKEMVKAALEALKSDSGGEETDENAELRQLVA